MGLEKTRGARNSKEGQWSMGSEKVCGARKRDARDIHAFSCPVLSRALRIFFIDWVEGIFFLVSLHEGHTFFSSPVLHIRAPGGF